MAKEWRYGEDNKHIVLSEPPKQKLRITGHRVASVLGLNQYQTPFGAWCEITKLVKLPFEDTKYTIAGKTIEPKLIDVVREEFPNIMSIEEYYGNNLDRYKWNNFIDESDIFGGIIDAVGTKNDMKTITLIVECKTSSKPQEWDNNNVPLSYLLQGCEYAYLKKLDRVVFICAFLQEVDYNHPEKFVPTKENTKLVVKKIKDVRVEMPNGDLITFEEAIEYCEDWWHTYIDTGISPPFDEKKDKEYLDIIRTSKPINDNALEDICKQAIELEEEIERLKEDSGLKSKEEELSILKESIKEGMLNLLQPGETKISCSGYKLSGSVSTKFDSKSFQKDHPKTYEKYCTQTTTFRLSKMKEGEE